MNRLLRFIRRQEFTPGLFGLFVNPFYFARRNLYRHVRALAPELSGKLLDVGCGRKPYREFFNVTEYVGLDIENSGHNHTSEDIDVFYDGKTFPFENASFDAVICSQVLEHVFLPDAFLTEINRVLKKSGKMLLTVPFVWDEHEQPYDYARYTSFGVRALLERNGFSVIKQIKASCGFEAIFQMWNACLYSAVAKVPIGCLRKPLIALACAPVNVFGAMFLLVCRLRMDGLFLDNIIFAKKE